METRIISGSWESPSSAARNVIVFENRNKSYGAYHLRSKYKDYVSLAALIGITCFVLSVTGPKIYDLLINKPIHASPINPNKNLDPTILQPPPPTEKKLNKPPDVEFQIMKQMRFTTPIVTDKEELYHEIPTLSELQHVVIGSQNVDGSSVIDYEPIAFTDNTLTEEPATTTYKFVEQFPEFPGGEAELIKFINKNIQYPSIARENGIAGQVVLAFVVSADGSISGVKVLRDIGGGCAEEAIRMVNKMPKWIPGKQNGREVNVEFNLPINFELR